MSISFPLLNGLSAQANNNLATNVPSPIQSNLSARHRRAANYCAARRGKLRSRSMAALKMLAGRLRKCAELVEALSLREVDQRPARWLMAEARTRGRRVGAGLEVTLVLTNQQIAAHIRSVREVVSRALSRLQQKGLIQLDGRQGAICDDQALEVFAGG
jgi:CRP-like cAMP-binding protein